MSLLTILFIVAFFLYIQLYFYLSKRERDLKERLKNARSLVVEHRIECLKKYEDRDTEALDIEYWHGSLDTARWFADLLLDVIYSEGKKEARK